MSDDALDRAREAVANGDVTVPPDPAAHYPIPAGFHRGLLSGALGGLVGLGAGLLGLVAGGVPLAMVAYVSVALLAYRAVAVDVFGADPWFGEPRTPHVARVADQFEGGDRDE